MIWGHKEEMLKSKINSMQSMIDYLTKELCTAKERINNIMAALDLVEVKQEAVPGHNIIKKRSDLTEAEKKPLITAEDLQRNIAVNPYENTGVQAGNFLKPYM